MTITHRCTLLDVRPSSQHAASARYMEVQCRRIGGGVTRMRCLSDLGAGPSSRTRRKFVAAAGEGADRSTLNSAAVVANVHPAFPMSPLVPAASRGSGIAYRSIVCAYIASTSPASTVPPCSALSPTPREPPPDDDVSSTITAQINTHPPRPGWHPPTLGAPWARARAGPCRHQSWG